MNPFLIIAFITLLPWIELRGAIPVGILLCNLDPSIVFIISVPLNAALFFPIFIGLTYFYRYVDHIGFVKKVVEGARRRGHSKVEKYGYLGLALLVAIPLPFTGVYTGTLAAWLLGLDFKKSFFAVLIGTIIAGVLVTIFSTLFGVVVFQYRGLSEINIC